MRVKIKKYLRAESGSCVIKKEECSGEGGYGIKKNNKEGRVEKKVPSIWTVIKKKKEERG
jgi:hypothetical protein